MPRDITVQFEDGTSHVYAGAPDDATPEQVYARASKDFANKKVVHLDGGRGNTPTKQKMGVYDAIPQAFREGLAGIGNTVDRAASGIMGGSARLYGMEDASDSIYSAMQERINERNKFAENTTGKEVGVIPHVIGNLPTLPAQIMTFPLSPFQTGQTMVENDESLGKALAGTGIATGANAAMSVIPPALGGNLATKMITGGIGQVALNEGQQAALRQISDNPSTKKAFAVTDEDRAKAAAMGMLFGSVAPNHPISLKRNKLNVPAKADPVLDNVQKALETPQETPAEPKAPDVMRVTPEGQAYDPSVEAWRQRALELEQQAKERQTPKSNESQQMQLFDQPEEGRFTSPYEAATRDWRIDENGMPIAADLSMDVQNAANPLQRNLWGDELPSKRNPIGPHATLEDAYRQHQDIGQGGIPLTEAIDGMPKAERSRAIASELTGAIDPTGHLLGAMAESRRRGGKQSGAIDIRTLEDGFEKLKTLPNGIKLRAWAEGDGQLNVTAHDANGKYIGGTRMSPENYRNPKPEDFMSSLGTDSSRKGTATEMYKFVAELGNDIVPSKVRTSAGKGMWEGFEKKGLATNGMIRGQRGGLNIRDIARTADEATTKLKAALRNALPARTDADKLLGNTIRDNSFIVKHKSGEEMAAAIAAGPDYPFWKLGQSGLVNAGDKAGNAGVSMVGRALNWAKNMENKLVRDHVKPVEKHFSLLPKQDLQHAMKVMHMEDQANKRLTPEQLREAGVSDKAIEAIQQFRKVTDQGIEMINANNKLLGMKEVSRRDAYFSSQSNGDYVIRGTDGNGKPIFTTAETLKGAKTAQKWIQDNVPGAKDLKMIDRRDGYQGRGPRDVTNTYETLMEVFHDTPMGAELQQLMEQYKQNQAFDARGFSSHFLDKSGARFFLGDRPWLSAEKNAEQAAQAQVKYLKDMYRWIPAQEMMMDVKKVLGNEELQQSHPHSMSLINAYVNQYFGVAENILRRFEDKAGQAMGLSGSVMRSQLAGVKSMTYHLQLGFSAGYAIATPIQMLPMSIASHMMLSDKGLKHNPIITTANTLRDVNYAIKVFTGEILNANWSKTERSFANEAIRFMEDNGVVTKTFRDEYASLGTHPLLDAAAKISEKTITMPDHFARMLGFFSFAHHLKDSGVKMSNLEIFQKAAELTEKAAVPLDRHNRPLLFDQIGMVGEAASMYKAPVFQYYNNLIELGSNASKTKNYKPLVAFLAISYAMGGMLGLPGVKEADSVIELMKDWMSKMPGMEEASIKMKDFGIRQSMMDYTPDWNTYGALSTLTGINLQSRFTNEAFDAQHPLGAFSPVAQEMKEWGSLGLAALHRDKASVEQGIYDAAANPMMKGWMENNLSDFQGTTAGGKTQVIKPTDIRSHKPIYARDDREKLLRSLGLYSTEEAKTRELRFRGQQDDMRMTPVRDRLIGELVHKLITKQNTDGYVQKFFEAGGEDSELAKLLDSKLTSTMGTPEQLAVMKANTIREFQSIQRNQRRGMKY